MRWPLGRPGQRARPGGEGDALDVAREGAGVCGVARGRRRGGTPLGQGRRVQHGRARRGAGREDERRHDRRGGRRERPCPSSALRRRRRAAEPIGAEDDVGLEPRRRRHGPGQGADTRRGVVVVWLGRGDLTAPAVRRASGSRRGKSLGHAAPRPEEARRDGGLLGAEQPARLGVGEPHHVHRHQRLAQVRGQGGDGGERLVDLRLLVRARGRPRPAGSWTSARLTVRGRRPARRRRPARVFRRARSR